MLNNNRRPKRQDPITHVFSHVLDKALRFQYESLTPHLKYAGVESNIFRAIVYFEPTQFTFALHYIAPGKDSDLGSITFDKDFNLIDDRSKYALVRHRALEVVKNLSRMQAAGSINIRVI